MDSIAASAGNEDSLALDVLTVGSTDETPVIRVQDPSTSYAVANKDGTPHGDDLGGYPSSPRCKETEVLQTSSKEPADSFESSWSFLCNQRSTCLCRNCHHERSR